MIKDKVLAGLSTLIVALTGCGGGEPSESEIAEAMQKHVQQQIASSQGMFDETDLTLNSVKKVGCAVAEGRSGYMCDVDIDMNAPFVGNQKGIKALRFVESDGGWAVVDENK